VFGLVVCSMAAQPDLRAQPVDTTVAERAIRLRKK
jgi:hypothetical protein